MKRKVIIAVVIGVLTGIIGYMVGKYRRVKSDAKRERRVTFYEVSVKRFLDVLCSVLALVVFWWLYLIIALLVKLKLGSPVLFTQDRPGKDEKVFKLYKFRTMTDAQDENGELLPDEVRLSKFGKWLRSTSLDELPEVFNILKGDMSVVGPRPLLVEYLPYYTEEERHRHDVRPGLTGWAQVNGRNSVAWDERFKLDVEYVNHLTFFKDLEILFLTVKKVVERKDIAMSTGAHESNMADERHAKEATE